MNTTKYKNRNYKRKRTTSQRSSKINDTKIFSIFLGCLFIFFGVFVGDFNSNLFSIPSYLSISIGFAIQLFTIAIFVKQNSIKTDDA